MRPNVSVGKTLVEIKIVIDLSLFCDGLTFRRNIRRLKFWPDNSRSEKYLCDWLFNEMVGRKYLYDQIDGKISVEKKFWPIVLLLCRSQVLSLTDNKILLFTFYRIFGQNFNLRYVLLESVTIFAISHKIDHNLWYMVYLSDVIFGHKK